MNKYLFYICLILMSYSFSCSQVMEEPIPIDIPEALEFDAIPGSRPIDLNPDDWVLDERLSDQFTTTSIQGSKWDNNVNDWGPWSWEPRNAYHEDGILNLRMNYEEHTAREMNMYYKSGIIRSVDTITYGYMEAKIKGIPLYPTASPAFWLYSIGPELDSWGLRGNNEGDTRYSEIDIVELTQGNWNPETRERFPPEVMDCNLHVALIQDGKELRKRPGAYPELLKTEYTAPWDPRDDYHTYGAEVTPEKITFYIDGEKIAEKDNLHWHLPLHVTLSLGLRYPHVTYNDCPDNLWRCPVDAAATKEGFPTTMKVDWVRCYRKK